MNVESLPQDLIIHLFWHAFAFACIFVCIENIRTFVYVVTESFAHICDTSWAPGQVMGTTLANQLRINTSYAGFVRWTRCCHELTAGHLVWWPSSRSVMGKTVLKLECPTAFQQKAKQTFFGCLLNQPCDALRSSPKKQKHLFKGGYELNSTFRSWHLSKFRETPHNQNGQSSTILEA